MNTDKKGMVFMTYYPEGTNPSLEKFFSSDEEIYKAISEGGVYEGRVTMCDSEHNLHVTLGGYKGIIPYNEGALGINEGTVRDIALISKVNKKVCFCVIDFVDFKGEKTAILSRCAVQKKCNDEYLSLLVPGDVIDAKVTHLDKFGAFIDIGAGINSLIPIDMLSVSRISHAAERLCENQRIHTVLRSRTPDKLTFSLKELLGTWEQNAKLFTAGETVTGIVRSVESYGVFVELMPNLAGLAEPCENLEEGQCVSVYIKSIMPQKMKIKLVIVESFGKCCRLEKLNYFDERRHIDYWSFSPPGAPKIIQTVFNE